LRSVFNFSFTDVRPVTLGVAAAIVTTIAVVAAFAVGTLRIFEDTYPMSAVLAETGDLRTGDLVRMAGIEIGRVTSVSPDFDQGVVVVGFEVDRAVDVGDQATVEVSLATLLGGRYVRLGGPVQEPFMADLPEEQRRIPIERTRLPLGVQDALDRLTGTIEEIDADGVDELLRASADVAADNADAFDPLLTDVVTLTEMLNGRREQIDALLRSTGQLTDALAAKDDTIDQLVSSSASLLA
jgi:phospholipid/cholesterol/gamma-HCH transport system substrate-binding protein